MELVKQHRNDLLHVCVYKTKKNNKNVLNLAHSSPKSSEWLVSQIVQKPDNYI